MVTKSDLTADEWHWLERLGKKSALSITTAMFNRLKTLGLAEETLGGVGLSRDGRRIFEDHRRQALQRRNLA
ncbi:Mn-dependent DtxR family transcriptional regulator [Peteryoungia aggregata LMG 23059]|uniref:Mn-dependent DtxR family transcriptional regulator n=1 Tax=Peteryoungia aggregata LMG 23059 TaxID=1368425 RepID=A0ABU0G743_9HYPH|nr:hypothetical protein [Peteryoungia aggregata]MDQ0421108.1 Mn-dependent DtxR family transcriptional regulator [Peteryoungia aggregata LMG 23059]